MRRRREKIVSDLTGVTMRIPVSTTDASKSLKLTVDGNDVNFTLTTSGGQNYVTFTLAQPGTYRLYAVPSQPSDSSDTALWVCLGTASLLGLGVTSILCVRKKKQKS